LRVLGREGLTFLVKFILKILESNSELYKNFIEFNCEDDYYGKTILMEILPRIDDEKVLEQLLDEIFNFYGENIFD
jgi:predicted neutral ceramidase superfamily lipid hydrolase